MPSSVTRHHSLASQTTDARIFSHPSAAKRDDALTQPSPPSQSANNANRSLSGSPIVSKALAALDAASRGEDLTDSDDDDAALEPNVGDNPREEEEESEDDAARRIQTWFRGYKSRREESEEKVREVMAEKRRTLERIARARDEDRRAKPSTPAAAAAAETASPERPVWPEDAPAPASASPIGGGFKSFVRDVAARVIQRRVREFIAARRTQKTPVRAAEPAATPVSGPRVGAVPAPFRRAVVGERPGHGDGDGEASHTQTSSPTQTLSPSPERLPKPSPAMARHATPPRLRRSPAEKPPGRVVDAPPQNPRASVSDDTLASIMSYLDAVENEGAVPTHHAAAGGTSLAHQHAPSSSTANRRVVPEWVRSGFSAPTHSHPPAREEEGPAAGRFGLAAVLSQYRPQTPIPGLADEETSSADGGVALATATNVYEGVRARMDSMKSELQRRDKLVAKLEAELRIAYDRAAAQTAQQLQDQRQAHETATQRHLDFAERLLKDKDELAGRCAELSESLAAAEARHASQSAEMKAAYGEQLKKAKQKWDEAQAKWESEKTLEIKEMTIRGLEPEIQRLVQKHRNEVGDLIEKHREETRRLESHLTTKHEDAMRALRAEMNAQFEEELERERASGGARLRDQAERHEQSMKTFRERAAADGASGTEMYEKGRREEREKYEQVVQRLNEEHTRREERMADQAAASADAVRRRHDADLAALQTRLDQESAAWRAKVTAKAQEALREREKEIKARAIAERDREIEAIAARLREEAVNVVGDSRAEELRATRERAGRAERAASAAERESAAAKEKACALERELRAVRETAIKEGVVGGAFEDRIKALAAAAAAAEKRAAECEAELAKARLMKEDEAAALEARVRMAIGKKDETIAQLTAQLNATKALLEEAPMCLED